MGRALEARSSRSVTESPRVRALLIATAAAVVALLLVVPLIAVFASALREGLPRYFAALSTRESWAAIRLTLLAVAIVVPANAIFGLAAAWLIARFQFRGKGLLVSLLDLPFAISPVVAGFLFVLLVGRNSPLGAWLLERDIQIIFAPPAIVLATAFVTLPFVAREVLALMKVQGSDPEEAALTLGAGRIQTFLRVTLPRVKWSLLYGIVLCSARAMGEFGAVSVVSGHIRGVTNTMPLHVEALYNDYDFAGAFAVASLLSLLALIAVVAKKLIEWRVKS